MKEQLAMGGPAFEVLTIAGLAAAIVALFALWHSPSNPHYARVETKPDEPEQHWFAPLSE